MTVTVGKRNRYQYQGLYSDCIPFQKSDITLTAIAGAETSEDLVVPGAEVGDFVDIGLKEDKEDGALTASVTAADVVTVTLGNATGSTITIAAAVLNGLIRKPVASWPNIQ